MAIVYQHRRKDTNEVFYIGIGETSDRAYDRVARNRYWKNIVNKVGYEVDVLLEGISRRDAGIVEKGLIKDYGRADLGLGQLVNLTDGGDGGPVGVFRDSEYRSNMSRAKSGVPSPLKGRVLGPYPKERGEAISKANRGRPSSFKNKTHSEEAKQKNREKHLGVEPPNKGKVCINKDGKNSYVHISELQNFLDEGWSKGGIKKLKNKN